MMLSSPVASLQVAQLAPNDNESLKPLIEWTISEIVMREIRRNPKGAGMKIIISMIQKEVIKQYSTLLLSSTICQCIDTNDYTKQICSL